ncbi:MAG: hypothetical protein EKK34_10750 [Mycobacterium sp.]|nr:MAG: hypothetical protein EKK34_10750 [Mycobacterium sp.]
MNGEDVVDPGHAALQQLLASVAEHTLDPANRDALISYLTTMPPVAEWSAAEREVVSETCVYIISLARMGRELADLNGFGNSANCSAFSSVIRRERRQANWSRARHVVSRFDGLATVDQWPPLISWLVAQNAQFLRAIDEVGDLEAQL